MDENIYPFLDDEYLNTDSELPIFTEFDYDFKKNDFIVENHGLKIVEGVEALKVWIKKALLTDRYLYEIYSWDYGTELGELVGQKYTKGLTESEAFRYIKEALLVNPHIIDVTNNGVNFSGDTLEINIKVVTVYGGVDINVRK